jgi:ketosteroid isomerase-like protein
MTRPASMPAAEATARMVVRSYPALKKTWVAASRMRASQILRIREGRIVLFRDFADPRVLADVIGEPRPGS